MKKNTATLFAKFSFCLTIRRILSLFTIFLFPLFLYSQTTFKVDAAKGEWNVFSGSQSLVHISSHLNGKNILLNTKRDTAGLRTTIDGLDVYTQVKVINGKWVQLAVSVTNHTTDTLAITSFEPLSVNCNAALKGSGGADLRMMWESATYEVGRAKDGESYYYTALYSDKNRMGPAWMITYHPPQLWTSMIKKKGDSLIAYVNFRDRKFPVDPGETIAFDPILLSAEFNAMEGWQAIGKMYTPAMPAAKVVEHSGFNTWDF